ncbi:MAG TPA: homoserine dehydrogenase [Bacillota bacterium]|nr:homoserine dehydrogenase [Bacillota bacterium]HOL10437.1 homoserine dehydrogenase [Bacillota bacterium]HPO98375.1 homoserine dehydrogenase [Bacillota bacterium]
MKDNQVNVGIIGLGTVGTGVARILLEQKDLLTTRTGLTFKLSGIAELNWDIDRNLDLTGVNCYRDANQLLDDASIDIIIETIGGYEPAYTFVAKALKNRKHVVTANKALIATKGRELFKLAQEYGVDLMFEASVGGGIPIIKGLREGLVANKIQSMYGILNGTSNYILTRMYQEEMEFGQALQEAKAKGFAEADPTLDVGGGDAAHKLTILASIAASGFVDFNKLSVEGITKITKLDIKFAKDFGYVIKLLAVYREQPEGLDLRVHPTLVPNSHLLAAVSNELNAVFVKGDFVGSTMFYGPGAGERPTASAIVSDIVDLSRDLLLKEDRHLCNRTFNPENEVKVVPIEEISNRYYLRFFTLDEPGILSRIAGVLGEFNISIASMVQLETHEQEHYVPIVLLTHQAREKDMNDALAKIGKYDFVKDDYLRLRLF